MGAPSLTITDTSANGTGLQLPGEALVRLAKDKPTPISSGSQIALPMKVKKAEDGKQQQASFVVSFDSPSGVREPAQESTSAEKRKETAKEDANAGSDSDSSSSSKPK